MRTNYAALGYFGQQCKWLEKRKVAVWSSSDNTETVQQIADAAVTKISEPTVFIRNSAEFQSDGKAYGALAILSNQLERQTRNSGIKSAFDSVVAADSDKLKIGDIVVAKFTGIIIDALFNALSNRSNSSLDWNVLITSPDSIASMRYRRAFFSSSADSLFKDPRFDVGDTENRPKTDIWDNAQIGQRTDHGVVFPLLGRAERIRQKSYPGLETTLTYAF